MGQLEPAQHSESVAVAVALEVLDQRAAIPPVAEHRAQRVLTLLHDVDHVEGVVAELMVVAVPARREHVVADASTVQLEFVHTERGDVQARSCHRRRHGERTPEVRARLGRLEILVPGRGRRTPPASRAPRAGRPRRRAARSTAIPNRRSRSPGPGPCGARGTATAVPARPRAPIRASRRCRSRTRWPSAPVIRSSYPACIQPGMSVSVHHERRGVATPMPSGSSRCSTVTREIRGAGIRRLGIGGQRNVQSYANAQIRTTVSGASHGPGTGRGGHRPDRGRSRARRSGRRRRRGRSPGARASTR